MDEKVAWLQAIASSSDHRAALRVYCAQYHYFSLHQIRAFSGLLRLLPPNDREALAQVAEVVYEELGEGDPRRVHSLLFERFAKACGLDPATLPLPKDEVLPGVREYVDELEAAFVEGPLSRALAAYVFLEKSALETYPMILSLLKQRGMSEHELEFFSLHAVLEIEHSAAAERLLNRLVSASETSAVQAQNERMREKWAGFWSQIFETTVASPDAR